MSVTVNYALASTIVETLPNNTGSAEDAKRRVTHDAFNVAGTLNGNTDPPATVQASFVQALNDGAATIDLTSLVGTNGAAVDGTGLRVQILRVRNLGANALTVEVGDTNGYDGLGTFEFTIPQNGAAEFFLNDAGSNIGGSNKTIDLSGTSAQTSQWTIVMG